jgi:hypothetical protein
MTPSNRETAIAKRAAVIEPMIASLRRGENRQYYVGLTQYYIEGIPYSATGLSVDLIATPDICRTDMGFACTAMFPPELIEPATVKAKGIEKLNFAGQPHDLVRVRLEVMLEDIWSVAEFIDGQQHDLLLDSDMLASSLEKYSRKPH